MVREPIVVEFDRLQIRNLKNQGSKGDIQETARTISTYLNPTNDKMRLLGSSEQHHFPNVASLSSEGEQRNAKFLD